MSNDAKDDPATKRDVEEIVGRVVGEIVGDALDLVAKRFDKVDVRLDGQSKEIAELRSVVVEVREEVADVRIIAERTERKVDVNIQRVDEHSVLLGKLKRRPA